MKRAMLLLAVCVAAAFATTAPAAPDGLSITATVDADEVDLGEDIVVRVRVQNSTAEPIEIPELRLAADALTIDLTGSTVRDTTITRLFGQFHTGDGQVVFDEAASRRRDVPPGGALDGVVRFPAVALGEFELTAKLETAADTHESAAPVTVRVLPMKGMSDLHATVETTRGTFVIQLDGSQAFNSVAHFWHLARTGYYADLAVHRVVPGKLMQTGDNRGDGTGNAGWHLPPEPATEVPLRGQVALARGAHSMSASAQWFVALADCESMPAGGITVLGSIVEGLDVLDELGDVELLPGTETPREPDRVRRVSVEVQ